MTSKELLLDMLGFGCASCAYTIEKVGRRIQGVKSIRVDLAEQLIRIVHDGDEKAITEEITSMVHRIGHDVRVREEKSDELEQHV